MKMQDAKALDNFDRLRHHLKDGSIEEAAKLIRELEHILAEESVGQREGPFRTCD